MVLIGRSVSQLHPMKKEPCKVLLMGLSEKQKRFPLTLFQLIAWFIVKNLWLRDQFKKKQRSRLEIFLMMSKDCEFHSLTFKEASCVFRSMHRHGSRRNEVIYHAEARWLSRGNVSDRVFQLRQELRFFLAQTRTPNVTNFQGKFWLYLNLSSLLWIAQPFTDNEFGLNYTHVATTKQKTAGHRT